MDLDAFEKSLAGSEPPDGLSLAARALWWDGKGAWDKAHECAQEQNDSAGAWVHAYLHRKEGDAGNAGYWYARAGKPHTALSLIEEWRAIARELLGNGSATGSMPVIRPARAPGPGR